MIGGRAGGTAAAVAMDIFLRDLLKTRGIRTFELELLAFGPTPAHHPSLSVTTTVTAKRARARLSIRSEVEGAGGIRRAQKQLRPRRPLLIVIPIPLSERAGLDVWSPNSILKGSGPRCNARVGSIHGCRHSALTVAVVSYTRPLLVFTYITSKTHVLEGHVTPPSLLTPSFII